MDAPILNQTLQYHDTLNPIIFDSDGKMLPDVREALLKSADSFIEDLKPSITKGMIKDICLTGSNANFNYTVGSDCDLHIMIDYPSEMYEDYSLAKKTVWNKQHNVSIHGFPVEVYPQDTTEKFVKGAGWYSVSKDEWLQKPEHLNSVDFDNPEILSIASKYAKQIEFLIKYHVTDMQVLHHLGEVVWGLRDQAKTGEFGINNLAFKELRNAGLLEKFNNYLSEIQDKALSL